jgi:hypothetical protein
MKLCVIFINERNLLVHYRVNDNLYIDDKLYSEEGYLMGQDNEDTRSFPVDGIDDLPIARVASGEGSMTSLTADRLYQLAAVTAGIFLLVTLL